MFCNACGAALEPNQSFCSRCGQQIVPSSVPAYPRPDRVQEHVRLVGILWFAISALSAFGGVVLLILANTLFVRLTEQGVPAFVRPLIGAIGVFILGKACAGFIAGWGLLQHQPWGRMLTLILSFLALFNVPLGTALGIYSLWVLLPAESERQYEQLARAAVHA